MSPKSWTSYSKTAIHHAFSHGLKRLSSIQGSPNEIALGFAFGVFIGMTPTIGLQMLLAGFVATLLGWNAVAAVMGVWITSPATAPFIYSTTYVVGASVYNFLADDTLTLRFKVSELSSLIYKTPKVFVALTIGGILLGLPLAILCYYAMYILIYEYRKDKEKVLQAMKRWLFLDERDEAHHPDDAAH